jgi:hypothetical protein
MKLVVNPGKQFTVYGRDLHGGDEFEVPDNEGETWKKLGWASAAPLRQRELTRDMKAEEEDSPPRRGPGRPRKEYSRRDMRAEDE